MSCFPVVPVSPNVSMWGLQLNVVCLFQEQLQLKNVEKQLLHLQREARRQSKDQELCGLTPRSQLVCLAVYILSGFRLDVAEAFVRDSRKCRKRALPEEALSTDIPTKIREWFRDCPLECLYHLQQPPASSEKNKAVHEEAAKYVAKWDTAAWVTQQNYICGVAPTYDALVHKYFQELDKRDLAHLSERLQNVGTEKLLFRAAQPVHGAVASASSLLSPASGWE